MTAWPLPAAGTGADVEPTDDDRRRPTTNHPLNGPEKRGGFPLLMVVLIIVGVLAVFGLITLLRYTT